MPFIIEEPQEQSQGRFILEEPSSKDDESLPSEYYAAKRKKVGGQVLETIGEGFKKGGELVSAAAMPLFSWPIGKIAGATALVTGKGGKGAREYEQAVHELLDPKVSKETQAVMWPVEKAMEAVTYPAKKLGEGVEYLTGSPGAGWAAETAGELITFGYGPKAVKKGIGKLQGPKGEVTRAPIRGTDEIVGRPSEAAPIAREYTKPRFIIEEPEISGLKTPPEFKGGEVSRPPFREEPLGIRDTGEVTGATIPGKEIGITAQKAEVSVPSEVPKGSPELGVAKTAPRTTTDIIKDIGTVLNEKIGLTIEDVGGNKERELAKKRLGEDYDRIKDLADSEMKSVDEYLKENGIPSQVFAAAAGKTVEKGDYVGEGQKARSFAISTATSDAVVPEVKSGVIEEIKPGGRGAYTPITLKGAEAEAVNRITADTERAVRYTKSTNNPGAIHTAVGVELIKKFQKEGNFERATDVALELSKRLTKAGQEIVAAKLIGNLSPEGVLITGQRAIEHFNNKVLRKAGTKLIPSFVKELELGPDTAKKLHDLSKAIGEAADENIKLELSQELQKTMNALTPSTIGQKVSTLQIIAQLFNPKTVITRNPLGNELFYRVERLTKYPVSLVDWFETKMTGDERVVTFKTGGAGQGKYWEGWLTGWKSGWEGVNPKGLQTQYDLGRKPAFRNKPYETKLDDGTWVHKMPNVAERVGSFLERTLGATLKSFDHAAYNRAYWDTVGEMATLKSINETGKINRGLVEQYTKVFDENVNKIADEYGKYVTFQDNNTISVGLSRAKKAMNLGLEFGVGDMILKYPRTPGALLARGLEYSPAGILKSAYEAIKPLFTDAKINNRELSASIGRAVVGSLGLSALGYYFFDNGIITGPANKDKDVASAQRTLGTHPYKVNMSAFKRWAVSLGDKEQTKPQKGDTFYSYDWAQPVAFSIAGGATMAKEYGERKVFTKAFKENLKGTPNAMYRGMESAIETLINQPVLSGFIKLTQGYGSDGIASSIVNLASEVPASFTPTLLSQIRQIQENTKRSTYDPDVMLVTINKMTNKIPGLQGYLPESYDTLGYKKELYPQGGNNPFNVMLNPGFVSKFLPTAEDSKAMKVYEQTGSVKAFPKEVGKTIGIPVLKGKMQDTLQVELTAQEYSQLQKMVGTTTRQMFSKIPDNIPVEAQEMLMTQMLVYAGIIGRQKILPSIKSRLRNQLKQENITVLR